MCGATAIIEQDTTESICKACHTRYWNNPRATVAVVFIKDGQVLFSKRAIEPHIGMYDLPGGFLTYNENPYDGCVREIQEETGVLIKPSHLKLFATFNDEYLPGVSVVDLVFIAETWEGIFVASDDAAALEWHDLSFMDSPSFHSAYAGLSDKLRKYQP